MGFVEDLCSLPFDIIESAVFNDKDRSMLLTFTSGNQLRALAPTTNNQYDLVKQEVLSRLSKDKVRIDD